MNSKIIISSNESGLKQKRILRDLNSFLKSRGIKTEIVSSPHKKGFLGGGILGGIATILTGGEGFFTKIGEAIVQYVSNKKTELSIKNEKGQEIALNSTMSHEQILIIINNFLSQSITESSNRPIKREKKNNLKKQNTPTKKTTAKSKQLKSKISERENVKKQARTKAKTKK